MATIKQKKVAKKIMENNGNVSKAMREVGYSANFARNPQTVTRSKGFQQEIKPFLEQLEEQKQLTLKRLKEEMDEAKFGELSSHLDRTVKQIELLSGRPTERTSSLADMPTEKLREFVGDD